MVSTSCLVNLATITCGPHFKHGLECWALNSHPTSGKSWSNYDTTSYLTVKLLKSKSAGVSVRFTLSLKGSRTLPVLDRHSCVYNALIFCNSASTAAVLLARERKVPCWTWSVAEMPGKDTSVIGFGSVSVSKQTLWRLCWTCGRRQLSFDLLPMERQKNRYLYLQSKDLTSMVALYQANLSFIWSATRVKYLYSHSSQAHTWIKLNERTPVGKMHGLSNTYSHFVDFGTHLLSVSLRSCLPQLDRLWLLHLV